MAGLAAEFVDLTDCVEDVLLDLVDAKAKSN